MNTAELFRITLKNFLEKAPRGTQSKIADNLGMKRRYINDFLKKRTMISEKKREQIAEYLGYTYLKFLIMGQQKLESDKRISEYARNDPRIEKIAIMLEQMPEEDVADIQKMSSEKIEKIKLREKVRHLENRKSA